MAKYNFQISYAPSRPRSSRRTATAASVTSVAAAPAVDISGKLDKAEFYRYFEEVNIGTASEPKYAIRAKYSLFTDGFLSSLGLNPGMGGGGDGSGTTYNRLDLWGDYTSERAGWVLSAALGYELHNRVSSLESGIVPDLSEYATRTWVQQQGYATSAALTAHAGDTSLHVTSSERTLWNRTAADFAAIVGADSDQIINKWEEVVAFLDTYTEADTLANLLSNKVDKVAGYGLSKNDFTDALLSKLNGIEAGANRYIHPTGGAAAAIDDAAGRVLAGITVNALGHVTSVSSKTLAAADIPTLSISKVSGLQDALDGKLDAATFDDLFEKVNIGTTSAPKYAIRAKYGLYADGFLSSLGLNSSGGGGTGGGSYDRLDLWGDYTSERAGWVLSAGLGYDLYNRVRSLEGGSALSFTDEGTGNVVTAVKKSGTAVVVTKGLTALTSHQPIYALNFQAGAFEAKKYTPNTGAQTVNIPTKTSHLSNDSGFITSAALTPYITSATANATFATKLGVSGNQIGTYVGGKLDNLITVPYAANADKVDNLHSSDFFRQYAIEGGLGKTFDFNSYTNGGYVYITKDINDATFSNAPFDNSGGGFGLFVMPYSSYLTQLVTQYASSALFIRNRFWSTGGMKWSEWRQFAYTDMNVASATKLQTARTLWGQSFDGTGNVSGNMTGVGSISASSLITAKAFKGTSINYECDDNGGTAGYEGEINVKAAGKLFLQNRGGTLVMCTNGGNVGIGNYSPAYKLDVVGNSRFAGEVTSTAANAFRMVYGNYGAFWRNDGQALYLMQTNSGDQTGSYNSFRPFYLELATGTVKISGTSGLTVLTGGNVGIGTSNPAYKLDVNGTTRINANLYLCSHGQSYFGLGTGDGATWATYNVKLHLHYGMAITDNADTVRFIINSRTGEFFAKGAIYSEAGIWSDGYMSAKGINTASDVRLKRRIADVALTVRDVAEAPVYRFAWINGGGIDVGSTAQYWGAKVPELTHLLADGTHLGLDYGKAAVVGLVPVAKATLANTLDIAEHGRQLKELYSRIASLERQLQNRTI